MASLICWASGLLEIVPDKSVPPDHGPVVLSTGTAGRLRSEMTAHGQYLDRLTNWYVPGTQDVPTEDREDGAVQHDRMTLVLAFSKKLRLARLKKKGLRHLLAAKEAA
jgi:hypothetical protein